MVRGNPWAGDGAVMHIGPLWRAGFFPPFPGIARAGLIWDKFGITNKVES